MKAFQYWGGGGGGKSTEINFNTCVGVLQNIQICMLVHTYVYTCKHTYI